MQGSEVVTVKAESSTQNTRELSLGLPVFFFIDNSRPEYVASVHCRYCNLE